MDINTWLKHRLQNMAPRETQSLDLEPTNQLPIYY